MAGVHLVGKRDAERVLERGFQRRVRELVLDRKLAVDLDQVGMAEKRSPTGVVQRLRDNVAGGLVALEFQDVQVCGLIEAEQVDAPTVSGMNLPADNEQRFAKHRRVAHDEFFEFVLGGQLRDCDRAGPSSASRQSPTSMLMRRP